MAQHTRRDPDARGYFGVDGHEDLGITVFTTRPDTLFGATYMVLAPEHPLVMEFARNAGREAEVRAFVDRVAGQVAVVKL